jgi:hypothetical protein
VRLHARHASAIKWNVFWQRRSGVESVFGRASVSESKSKMRLFTDHITTTDHPSGNQRWSATSFTNS